MSECLVCRSAQTELILNLGSQPVSSHFTAQPGIPVVEHGVALAVCRECGVIQLAKPFPFRDLVPPYEWITYREPESHLDKVVATVRRLAPPSDSQVVAGVTFKDKTSIERFRAFGVSRIWLLDPFADLGATDPRANIETVHGLLTPDKAQEIADRQAPADVLFVRHIFEHTEVPLRFLEAVGHLLAPNGLVVLEMPDCRANIERQDYTMIWEEHTLYLSPESIPRILAAAGYACLAIEIHPFPFEDVIVVYARKADFGIASIPVEMAALERGVSSARAYGLAYEGWTCHLRQLLDRQTADGRRLAAYGAGHLTSAFLQFHQLTDFFTCVVDDSPQKQGLFLPKSRLPIVPRSALSVDRIRACLFGLDPQLEDRIIANNTTYAAAGGEFYSMFVDSKRSIRALL